MSEWISTRDRLPDIYLKEIDISRFSNTTCSECKKTFCCFISLPCYVDYHRKNPSCKGAPMTITNPRWVINLRRTKQE